MTKAITKKKRSAWEYQNGRCSNCEKKLFWKNENSNMIGAWKILEKDGEYKILCTGGKQNCYRSVSKSMNTNTVEKPSLLINVTVEQIDANKKNHDFNNLITQIVEQKKHEKFSLYVDYAQLDKWMIAEKEKRGLKKDELMFVSAAHISSYYWCPMQSVLKSKANEIHLFRAYLENLQKYSYYFSDINNIEDLKEIDSFITIDVLNDIFNMQQKNSLYEKNAIFKALYPKIQNQYINFFEEFTPDEHNLKILSTILTSEHPMSQGRLCELLFKKSYDTFSWHFSKDKYVILCEPDGIGVNYIYEVKTTKNHFTKNFIKHIARAQANIYCEFYKKDKYLIHLYCLNENSVESIEEMSDLDKFNYLIENFKKVEQSNIFEPPKKWKCNSCQFRKRCPLYQTTE